MGYFKDVHTGWGRVSDYMWMDDDKDRELFRPGGSHLASGWQPRHVKKEVAIVDEPARQAWFDPDNDRILFVGGQAYETLFPSHEMAMACIQANELELVQGR